MKYNISLSEDGTFIRIRVFEAITGDMEKEFAENAIKDATQRGLNKFLVDVRGVQNLASTLDQYLFGYDDMNRLGLDKESRIAILVDENDRSHNFIETVFVNAGYDCRIFTEKTVASKWLVEET
jgi:hypothetical protein